MKQYIRYYADIDVGKAGDLTYDETYIHRLNGVDGINIEDQTPIPIPDLVGTDVLAIYNSPTGRVFALVENTSATNICSIAIASTVTVTEGQSSLAVADIDIDIPAEEKILLGPLSANFNLENRFRPYFTDGGGGGTLLVGDIILNLFKLS